METMIIAEDGIHDFVPYAGGEVTISSHTTVMVLENEDNAIIIFGCGDTNDEFVAYPFGTVVEGGVVAHGKGAKLKVNVTGITSNRVVIGLYPN